MYLIVTRTFPPEIGGMQNLMWGLARSLSKINLIKVFADYKEGHQEFDNSVSFSIERVKGIKILRKYRKSYLINEYLNKNPKVQCVIADHWKSLELIKTKNKKICLIHSKEINHIKGSRLNKKILEVLNNVDHVVANSNFTKKLAIDLGIDEQRIIVINPGVDPVTEIPKKDLSKAKFLKISKKKIEKEFVSMASMNCWIYEEDIGKMCSFLISNDSERISGQTIPVDGNAIRLD